MSIVPLLTSAGFFDPEATKLLTAAYDTAWQMLRTSGNVLAADFRAASTRDLLAKRIIETGSQGERNPLRLADDALAFLARQPSRD
jgi:tartrate dehydratase beta subunit/fumarate hydratase class I family protein